MNRNTRFLIVGLGLIGGAYARRLTAVGYAVDALDIDPAAIEYAVQEGINWSYMPAYLVGTAVAMVSGIGAISLLKYISQKGKFGGFAYYCWVVGVLSIILTMIF